MNCLYSLDQVNSEAFRYCDLLDDMDIVKLGFAFNLEDIDDKYELLKIEDKEMACKFIKYLNTNNFIGNVIKMY